MEYLISAIYINNDYIILGKNIINRLTLNPAMTMEQVSNIYYENIKILYFMKH